MYSGRVGKKREINRKESGDVATVCLLKASKAKLCEVTFHISVSCNHCDVHAIPNEHEIFLLVQFHVLCIKSCFYMNYVSCMALLCIKSCFYMNYIFGMALLRSRIHGLCNGFVISTPIVGIHRARFHMGSRYFLTISWWFPSSSSGRWKFEFGSTTFYAGADPIQNLNLERCFRRGMDAGGLELIPIACSWTHESRGLRRSLNERIRLAADTKYPFQILSDASEVEEWLAGAGIFSVRSRKPGNSSAQLDYS